MVSLSLFLFRKRKLAHVVRQWFSSFKKDFGRLNATLILTKSGIFFTTPLLLYSYSRLFKISLVLIVVAEVGSINHDDDGSENVGKLSISLKAIIQLCQELCRCTTPISLKI